MSVNTTYRVGQFEEEPSYPGYDVPKVFLGTYPTKELRRM